MAAPATDAAHTRRRTVRLIGTVHAPGRGPRTIVFDAPHRARAFFDALATARAEIIFGRMIRPERL